MIIPYVHVFLNILNFLSIFVILRLFFINNYSLPGCNFTKGFSVFVDFPFSSPFSVCRTNDSDKCKF